MLVNFIQRTPEEHSIDAGFVFEFSEGTDEFLETLDALDFKWRRRAIVGVADHSTKELVPAGFLEVGP